MEKAKSFTNTMKMPEKENELAEKFVLVKDMEFELNQFENKYGLKWMDDEDILEMADYVEKIMKILGKYRKK